MKNKEPKKNLHQILTSTETPSITRQKNIERSTVTAKPDNSNQEIIDVNESLQESSDNELAYEKAINRVKSELSQETIDFIHDGGGQETVDEWKLKNCQALKEKPFVGNRLRPEQISPTVADHYNNSEIRVSHDHDGDKESTYCSERPQTDEDLKLVSPNPLEEKAKKSDSEKIIDTSSIVSKHRNHTHRNQKQRTKLEPSDIKKIEQRRLEALKKQREARYLRLKVHLSQLLSIEEQIRAASTMVENEMRRCKPP